MAEIFGAVASGAGLLSLSMQLIESTQKLKAFYNASRDAPDTVEQLLFDMETMTIALQQFEHFRQNDVVGSELLGCCILTCDKAVAGIKMAADKMELLIHKSRFSAKVYAAFKEPEVGRLLEDMERAKSSMSLAYMGYCQSWNMRQTVRNAAALNLHTERMTDRMVEHMKLMEHTFESGNTALTRQLDSLTPYQSTSCDEPHQTLGKTTDLAHKRTRQSRTHKYRVVLPRWFTTCVWEFVMHEANQVWTVQFRPINIRPYRTYVFDFVRRGDVAAVRELLMSGQLSINDQEETPWRPRTLLEMAAGSGSLELCRLLLQTISPFQDEATLLSAFLVSLNIAYIDINRPDVILADAFHGLFIGEYGLDFDLKLFASGSIFDIYSMLHQTAASLGVTLKSQPIPLAILTPTQKFSEVVMFIGLPAETFLTLLCRENSSNPATSANSNGKTALHWAAAHFGEWSRMSNRIHHPALGFNPLHKAKSYRTLASRLIAMGADTHALWQQEPCDLDSALRTMDNPRLDPFLSFLTGISGSSLHWSSSSLSDAVIRWGEMIVEGGCSLLEYIDVENQLLLSLPSTFLNVRGEKRLRIMRLVLSEEKKLAIDVVRCVTIDVWKAQTICTPGAWPAVLPSHVAETLIWCPRSTFHQDGYRWEWTDGFDIESPSYQVQSSPTTDHKNDIKDSFHMAREHLFEGSQDDHGMVAAILTWELKTCHERNHGLRRRAVSVPAFEAPLRHDMKRYSGRSRFRPGGCFFHKCIFDSRWSLQHKSLWSCMQGRTHEHNVPTYLGSGERGWERSLFCDEDHIPVARRHAERFCPEKGEIVEHNSQRATDRIRLAMGPKRYEDVNV